MTPPAGPASGGPGSGAQGGSSQGAVGSRVGLAPQVDLERLTQKVYALLLEDLRQELARREGRVR